MEENNNYLAHSEKHWGVNFHPSISIIELGEDERGVQCIGDKTIPNNSILFTIPFSSIMTIVSLKEESQLYKKYLSFLQIDIMREDDLLVLLLLYEKYVMMDLSKWHQHIKILPKKYYSIPNFSNDQLELIKGSNLYNIGIRWKQQLNDDFIELYNTEISIPDDNNISVMTSIGELFKEWFYNYYCY